MQRLLSSKIKLNNEAKVHMLGTKSRDRQMLKILSYTKVPVDIKLIYRESTGECCVYLSAERVMRLQKALAQAQPCHPSRTLSWALRSDVKFKEVVRCCVDDGLKAASQRRRGTGRAGRQPHSHVWILLSYNLIKIHSNFISAGPDIQLPSCKKRQQFSLRYLRSTRCHPDGSSTARNHAVLTHQERMTEGEYLSPVKASLLNL